MNPINIPNKNWIFDARRAVDKFHNNGNVDSLSDSLLSINPYTSGQMERQGYIDWVNENANAYKAGDFTRFSISSSNSILNAGDDDNRGAAPVRKGPQIFRVPDHSNRGGKMPYIQNRIDELCRDVESWIETLVIRWNEFNGFDDQEMVEIPDEQRAYIRTNNKEEVRYQQVDANGVVDVDGKSYKWDDLDGELAILEVAYHLDNIITQLFTKNPEGIVEVALNQEFGDHSADSRKTNKEIALEIIQLLADADFIKRPRELQN